jgi:hypothetical protein
MSHNIFRLLFGRVRNTKAKRGTDVCIDLLNYPANRCEFCSERICTKLMTNRRAAGYYGQYSKHDIACLLAASYLLKDCR